MDDQPFTAVESEEAQKLFSLLNSAAITPSADTIRNGIIERFENGRTKVRGILQVYIFFIIMCVCMEKKILISLKLGYTWLYLLHTGYLDISKCPVISGHYCTLD